MHTILIFGLLLATFLFFAHFPLDTWFIFLAPLVLVWQYILSFVAGLSLNAAFPPSWQIRRSRFFLVLSFLWQRIFSHNTGFSLDAAVLSWDRGQPSSLLAMGFLVSLDTAKPSRYRRQTLVSPDAAESPWCGGLISVCLFFLRQRILSRNAVLFLKTARLLWDRWRNQIIGTFLFFLLFPLDATAGSPWCGGLERIFGIVQIGFSWQTFFLHAAQSYWFGR
mmetsp:Transcript_22735/g.52592  ORF Transcript_22735/g.52592 Transcript_22735/m.52592 type:complete len:222 (-) Transcript_22735:916-1581(-)